MLLWGAAAVTQQLITTVRLAIQIARRMPFDVFPQQAKNTAHFSVCTYPENAVVTGICYFGEILVAVRATEGKHC